MFDSTVSPSGIGVSNVVKYFVVQHVAVLYELMLNSIRDFLNRVLRSKHFFADSHVAYTSCTQGSLVKAFNSRDTASLMRWKLSYVARAQTMSSLC